MVCKPELENLTSGVDFGTKDLHTSNLGELDIESERHENSGGYVELEGFRFDPVQLHQEKIGGVLPGGAPFYLPSSPALLFRISASLTPRSYSFKIWLTLAGMQPE